jgi:hypothetical protein
MILKQQLKFILRAQDNEYVEEFLKQSRVLVNNKGMIGKIIIDQGWKYTVTLSELNECIKYKLEISMNVIDSYFFNEEAQKVKIIFQIRNGYLRSYKLNELLHYSTYQKTVFGTLPHTHFKIKEKIKEKKLKFLLLLC